MNRRGFLGAILAAGAAPAIVRADSLMRVSGLIVPPQEIVVLGGNQLLTIEMVRREALRILRKNIDFVQNVNRSYEAEFAEIGETIRIRRPAPYIARGKAA